MRLLILVCFSILFLTVGYAQSCDSKVNFSHISDGQIGFFQADYQSDCKVQSIRWDFGDGTTSTSENPIHTFPDFGTYEVCLEVKILSQNNQLSTEFSCATITVEQPICYLLPEVELNMQDGILSAYNISQVNQSTQILSCNWDLGDGAELEGEMITHTYDEAGLFEVCAEIEAESGGQTCIFQLCKMVQVRFSLPNFDLHVNETMETTCTYVLEATHELPAHVQLVSRAWYVEDEVYIADSFPISVSNQDPIVVTLKENYSYFGQQFSKTIEYNLYPQCDTVVSSIENNVLDQTRVQIRSGTLEVQSPLQIDRISVYTLEGKLLSQTYHAKHFATQLPSGIYIVYTESNGVGRSQKVAQL